MVITVTDPAPLLDWLPLLLQTSDTLFPTGAYAHSLGFEECVRLGMVHNEGSLRAFLIEHVLPAIASFELPYLRYAHAAAQMDDMIMLAELDAEVGATKLAREIRDASAQLGGRRLKALRMILPDEPRLAACEQAVQARKMAGHQVIVCGVQAAVAGMPLEVALGAFLYQGLAGVCSAALKIIRVGQDGVQRSLRTAIQEAPAAIRSSLTVTRDSAGWYDPLLEIASMRHERAAGRLFISWRMKRAVRIGIGGPVGSGKTMLALRLCQWLRDELPMAVVTNDIYTREDAEFLVREGALAADRVLGVETGGCPHTAIRDDTSMNLAAIADLETRHPDLRLILVESGGDNLSATFSPELVDAFIYVIDVAEGDKIPRKGGPAIRHSDLLLINKTELAPYVGADLAVMDRDARLMRGARPFLFADLRSEKGKAPLLEWLRREVFFV